MIKKLLRDSLKSNVDQLIDVGHARVDFMHVLCEVARVEAIRISKPKKIIRIEVTAVEQRRNKNRCVHREKVRK